MRKILLIALFMMVILASACNSSVKSKANTDTTEQESEEFIEAEEVNEEDFIGKWVGIWDMGENEISRYTLDINSDHRFSWYHYDSRFDDSDELLLEGVWIFEENKLVYDDFSNRDNHIHNVIKGTIGDEIVLRDDAIIYHKE